MKQDKLDYRKVKILENLDEFDILTKIQYGILRRKH